MSAPAPTSFTGTAALCPFCKKLPGQKVGPPAIARCITPGCDGTRLAAVTLAEWNTQDCSSTVELAAHNGLVGGSTPPGPTSVAQGQSERGEPVAWRWKPLGGTWQYSQNDSNFPDGAGTLEPLYAAPQPVDPAYAAKEPDALGYATRLLQHFVAEHFPHNPDWKPQPDLIGVLTQLDNATTIARDYKERLRAYEGSPMSSTPRASGPMVPWELNCKREVCAAPECDCPAMSSTQSGGAAK